ncbi:MAG TPA: type II secretion system protein [Kofleriaceae bacterium]|nr:type II secretion system protein [Kofleriaceae bacterium]
MKRQSQRGFTLIELMIVVAIIGILAAIAIPAFIDYMNKGKKTEASLQLNNIAKKVKTFYIEKADLPPTAAAVLPGADGAACGAAGGKIAIAQEATWYADPGWKALEFHIDQPSMFSYHWTRTAAPPNATGNALAVGDLDCDNTKMTYSLDVVVKDGNVQDDLKDPTPD